MTELPLEQPSPYASPSDSQCQFATSQLLRTARFMSEDSDRRVFRRFDELRLFVLLRLQHQLAAMATELESLRREHDSRALKGEIDLAKDKALSNLAIDVSRVLKDYGRYMRYNSPPLFFLPFCSCSCLERKTAMASSIIKPDKSK